MRNGLLRVQKLQRSSEKKPKALSTVEAASIYRDLENDKDFIRFFSLDSLTYQDP
jgi:hypothetical protein